MSKKKSKNSEKNSSEVLDSLRTVLADTFILYMKTYAVHWNYQGANFFSVHKLTEQQYQELAEAVDTIAERLRALGEDAPISLNEMIASADLKEFSDYEDPRDALRELVTGHNLLAKRSQQAADVTEDDHDDFSNDMMIGRIGAHQKASWMLGSMI